MVGRSFPQRSNNGECLCRQRHFPLISCLSAAVYQWMRMTITSPFCFLTSSMAAHWYFPDADLFLGPTSWSTWPPVLQIRVCTRVKWFSTITLQRTGCHMVTMNLKFYPFSFVLFINRIILPENNDNTLQFHSRRTTLKILLTRCFYPHKTL